MAAEIAKAYVQIIPSASGTKDALIKEMGGDVDSAGGLLGSSLGSALKKGLIAAGIGKIIGAAISEGADLQQSIGGVETMFKESADAVKDYANDAFKTAGLSANEYMEQVTGFSAALISSVTKMGGDTRVAAEDANRAIIDMADNANKMGTDMTAIQNAYQGFAKQNYTMLDNLKLGYGGTQAEMQRLLQDAEKLSGVHYDISNLHDVYNAIHVIQEDLGITGTTAKEASETFTGSFAAMKAAAENLLGNLALGEDVTDELQSLFDTARTFIVDNAFPMLMNLITGLFSEGIIERLPEITEDGLEMILALADGLAQNADKTIPAVVKAIVTIAEKLTDPDTVETVLKASLMLIGAVVAGIIKASPELLIGIVNVIENLVDNLFRLAKSWGGDLIDNFLDGIREKIQVVIDAMRNVAQTVKDFLGFSEPDRGPLSDFHTYAPDMMRLFAQGIEEGRSLLTDAISGSFDLGAPILNTSMGRNSMAATAPEPAASLGGVGGDRVINITLAIDGQTLWRQLVPYKQADEAMRGAVAVGY